MPLADRRLFVLLGQLQRRVLAHRLQHGVPGVRLEGRLEPDQAVIDQGAKRCEDVLPILGNGADGLQGEPAREDGEAAEERLLLGCQQVVRPCDGVEHRAVAIGHVPGTCR